MNKKSKHNLITPEEAARRLGLDRVTADPKRTVLRMARRGHLVAVRVSRFTMIDPSSIDRFIEGRP